MRKTELSIVFTTIFEELSTLFGKSPAFFECVDLGTESASRASR